MTDYLVRVERYNGEYSSQTLYEERFGSKTKAKKAFLAECAKYIRETEVLVDFCRESPPVKLDDGWLTGGFTTLAAKYRRNTWVELHPLWFQS